MTDRDRTWIFGFALCALAAVLLYQAVPTRVRRVRPAMSIVFAVCGAGVLVVGVLLVSGALGWIPGAK